MRRTDFVLVSTHEQPSLTRAGALMPQSYFEDQLRRVQQMVEPKRLIVGIGSYAADWDALERKRQISVQRAWDLLAASDASLSFDVGTLNPHFSYKTDDGSVHRVWF